MSDNSTADGGGRKGARVAKFKSMVKRRGKPFPVLLLMIAMLAIAMVYSLVTGIM